MRALNPLRALTVHAVLNTVDRDITRGFRTNHRDKTNLVSTHWKDFTMVSRLLMRGFVKDRFSVRSCYDDQFNTAPLRKWSYVRLTRCGNQAQPVDVK
jgi:hypothetical protein